MKVIKRDGRIVDYDQEKIRIAIQKANAEVIEEEKASSRQIENIVKYIESLNKKRMLVEDIQDIIEEKLMAMRKYELAKKYIIYRYTRALIRKSNTTDASILGLIRQTDREASGDHHYRSATMASSQRDYIAGEVSRDLTRRILLPEKISKAHEEGILYFHDADYFVQPVFHSCLVNLDDMLTNGTVINGCKIETPKSFQVACTVMTQIIASICASQSGEVGIDVTHLGKYLRKSKEKYIKKIKEKCSLEYSKKQIQDLAQEAVKEELVRGVQTLEYQINTMPTASGYAPVTFFLHLSMEDPYLKENALIIEEILKQHQAGFQNENGEYVSPMAPKLVYVLDEENCLKGGKFDYLTKLAFACSLKCMTPSYISASKMRECYQGNVFSPMGDEFLSLWKDKNGKFVFEGRFHQGTVTINLPQIAIMSEQNEDKFWEMLDERLELCKEALMCRSSALMGTVSDISPIHWQYGAITRLQKGEKIDEYLKGGYSTLALGYVGLYETTKLLKKVSPITEEGKRFAILLLRHLREKCDEWKKETGLGFTLISVQRPGLCKRFAKLDRERFGTIFDVTDKGYYLGGYSVLGSECTDEFAKLQIESEFQGFSAGGCESYFQLDPEEESMQFMKDIVTFIYENMIYVTFKNKEKKEGNRRNENN